jgi:aryl-alcohol dehydrogenase-like predicted oxidoreductase
MRYRLLGNSGCSISSFALGTLTFGSESAESVARAQLDWFTESGGTFIDTADIYGGGEAEAIVGRWLAQADSDKRAAVVLASKGRLPTGPGPNDAGLSRRHLAASLDASLRRLGVEAIDLYQVHAFDPLTPIEETLRFLDDARQAGKIHYVGLSNFLGWQTQQAVDAAAGCGFAPPVTLQSQYNLLAREIEWEIIPAARANGLGVLAWSPLGGGWLTGKYARNERPTGATRLGENPSRGVEAYDRRQGQGRTWRVVDALAEIAARRHVATSVVALSWLVARPTVSSVILGARTVEQLRENLGAVDVHLGDEEQACLDVASDPCPADYPYGEPAIEQRSRQVEGDERQAAGARAAATTGAS